MRTTPHNFLTYSLVTALMLSMLLGCGRKGGLYLPEEEQGESAPAAQPAPPATQPGGGGGESSIQ